MSERVGVQSTVNGHPHIEWVPMAELDHHLAEADASFVAYMEGLPRLAAEPDPVEYAMAANGHRLL